MQNEPLLIHNIRSTENGHRVQGDLVMLGKRHDVTFHSNDIQLNPNPESFLTLALIPAMKWRVGIQIDAEVSQRFLANQEEIQSLFLGWKPNYRRTTIRGANPIIREPATGNRVGLFFSGGLDSS